MDHTLSINDCMSGKLLYSLKAQQKVHQSQRDSQIDRYSTPPLDLNLKASSLSGFLESFTLEASIL